MTSRRNFLTHSCGLGVAAATSGTALLNLALTRQIAAAHHEGDYKALVCILLAGGNDSYNMLVPTDDDQFAQYSTIRSDLALSPEDLMVLPTPDDYSGRNYGLHIGMAEMHDLYSQHDVALLANFGTLVEPVPTAEEIQQGLAKVPVGLYSHSDQIRQWQTTISDSRSGNTGWLGRVADLKGPNLANGISMNISINNTNVVQSGLQASPYSIRDRGNGADGIFDYDQRKRHINRILSVDHSENLIRQEYRNKLRQAIDNQVTFSRALEGAAPLRTEFPRGRFARGLRQIARVISARNAFGADRQTFFIQYGGWDHHDEVLDNQARQFPIVSGGMHAFHEAMKELGLNDAVTTFTISDFARTLTSNGRGSDHGWGGHHLVMGGAVNGGRMYGSYPELAHKHPLDTGRGRIIPTNPTELYFAELALWFGVEPNELSEVLPNLGRFYSPGQSDGLLGFMNHGAEMAAEA